MQKSAEDENVLYYEDYKLTKRPPPPQNYNVALRKRKKTRNYVFESDPEKFKPLKAHNGSPQEWESQRKTILEDCGFLGLIHSPVFVYDDEKTDLEPNSHYYEFSKEPITKLAEETVEEVHKLRKYTAFMRYPDIKIF